MLLTALGFFVILGIIVLVHELGHFITARIFKVKVHEFGLGFPPRLFGVYKKDGKRKWIWGSKQNAEEVGETVYSLNKIPIGGFVNIKGQDGQNPEDKDSFANKPAWKRSIILVSGVLANFLLCAVVLMIIYIAGTNISVDHRELNNARYIENVKIQVISINSNSPAETAGILKNDVILQLDNQKVKTVEQIQEYSAQKDGLLVNVQIQRDEEILNLEVIPRVLETSNNRSVFGIGLTKTADIAFKWYAAIWYGIRDTIYLIGVIFVALWKIIKDIFTTGQVSAEIAGPIGIARITGDVVKMGWIYALQFTALLSVNLGIINILPIPALDGGRLLFILIEKIRGKTVKKNIENIIHTVGFAILMVLIVLVTYRDIIRWIK
ncbi:MAG: RIP metalloprotease RseP [Patescibacteria group bacterium]